MWLWPVKVEPSAKSRSPVLRPPSPSIPAHATRACDLCVSQYGQQAACNFKKIDLPVNL